MLTKDDVSRLVFFIISCIVFTAVVSFGPDLKGKDNIAVNVQAVYDPNVKVPILIYHNIMDGYNPDENPLHVSPAEFEEQMRAIQQAGYNTITFEDYYNFATQEKGLPEKPIIVTFDDGYTSNYEYGYPILKKLNMKATIFVVTGRMGYGPGQVVYPHFDWRQALEMEKSGVIDIESHTHLHPDMTKIDEPTAREELRLSKYLVESQLNKKCLVIAYPFGQSNANLRKMAHELGCTIQANGGEKGYNTKEQDLKALHRMAVRGGTKGLELVKIIERKLSNSILH